MTIRKLPELQRPDANIDVTFEIAPRVLASWDRGVTAAVEAENVISILDYIGDDGWGGGITARSISNALRQIGTNPVAVQINSPGGNYFEGLAIYNMFRAHPAEVNVQILGIAASAASVIAMAGDTISIAKAGLMMIHNTQWVAVGDRHTMLETHDTMQVFDEAAAGLYVDRTGIPIDVVSKMMDDTTFLAGPAAIEQGFADDLLPADRVNVRNAAGEQPVLYRIDATLAQRGVPRAERRKLLKDLKEGMPSAAAETDMPGAVDPAVIDGSTGLSLALARLKLMRA